MLPMGENSQVAYQSEKKTELLQAQIGAGKIALPVPGVGRFIQGLKYVKGGYLYAVV